MREIKFRGKRVDNGKWQYFKLHDLAIDTTVQENFQFMRTDTISQFTNLLDKNGKEIYEGDILSFTILGQKGTGEVIWEAPCFRVQGDDMDIVLGHDKEKNRKIIGNIYENQNY